MAQTTTKPCKDCSTEIPKNAKRCSACAADQRSWVARHPVLTGILVMIGLPVILTSVTPTPDTVEGVASSSSTPEENPYEWRYHTDTDDLTDTVQYFASVLSTNELFFDFPYNGGTRFRLVIRDLSEGMGQEVLITTPNAQFLTYDEHIQVRFDDGDPVRYGVNGSASGGSDTLFLQNSADFIARLQNSSSVRIEAPFYQEGREVVRFETENYQGLK